MRLIDIQHNYDTIFSLGDRCLTANKLRHFKLRPYAGIVDWMLTPKLSKIVNLLQNRFENFMNKETMVCEGYNHLIFGHLLLKDTVYDITSVHDFPIERNTPENWETYSEFKTKLERRIQRFINKLETCPMILFVRIGGTYEEAKHLEEILSEIVVSEFRVLILNEVPNRRLIEYDWGLQYTCSIGIPIEKRECNDFWNMILNNITCNDMLEDYIDFLDD
ncbi:DUF1796 family putative cysteine peptidase [Bacillus sp. SN10]|uniref:DUF1796 family putative cysteine peptidase n=1 Tax=Bacillus sp. SN10 TaxID=2056493 RepID=UPI000C3261DF|nr:DUF1796 family putative cysteine peptidase [Bacillus sp. SN10]PKJ52038.1 hypothetical protein CWE34_30125 [Bacillus sp. SN10]